MNIEKSKHEALLKQLEILENRMKHHIVKFWSLPLAYISVTFLSISRLDTDISQSHQTLQSYGLIAFGIAIFVAMLGSYEGTTRAIDEIQRIEEALYLKITVKKHWLHYIPYFSLVPLGVMYAAYQIGS